MLRPKWTVRETVAEKHQQLPARDYNRNKPCRTWQPTVLLDDGTRFCASAPLPWGKGGGIGDQ
jgi:hypothetical protein